MHSLCTGYAVIFKRPSTVIREKFQVIKTKTCQWTIVEGSKYLLPRCNCCSFRGKLKSKDLTRQFSRERWNSIIIKLSQIQSSLSEWNIYTPMSEIPQILHIISTRKWDTEDSISYSALACGNRSVGVERENKCWFFEIGQLQSTRTGIEKWIIGRLDLQVHS